MRNLGDRVALAANHRADGRRWEKPMAVDAPNFHQLGEY